MKTKKRAAQLEKRRQSHSALKGRLVNKAGSRYDAGGYREPGAMKHY